MDEADGAMDGRDRRDLRLGDRVVSTENEWDRIRGEHRANRLFDRRMGAHGVRRHDRRVAEVDDPQHLEGIDAGLQVLPR
jgi:hypothetical protein